MTVIQRALFTLISFALFIILIALKLDGRSEWNWFLVFSPMFGLDLLVIIMATIKWFQNSRRTLPSTPMALKRFNKNIYYLTFILSKLSFQIVLCFRLQYTKQLPFYIIMIPLWICLISCLTYFITHFFTQRSFFT